MLVNRATLGDEHQMVLLSILGTFAAGVLIFLVTIGIAGGISLDLFRSYVLPLFMSCFTLAIYWAILYARHIGKLPFLREEKAGTAAKKAEEKI